MVHGIKDSETNKVEGGVLGPGQSLCHDLFFFGGKWCQHVVGRRVSGIKLGGAADSYAQAVEISSLQMKIDGFYAFMASTASPGF